MRLARLAFVLFLVLPWPVAGQDFERAAVGAVIETWNQGWRVKDADMAAAGYAEDAEWINAFGMREHGRTAIAARLHEIFALPFVMNATSRVANQEIRFIQPDVAVVITKIERKGQRTSSGEELGVRHTSHQRVLHKQAGRWRIVSHLISDARAIGTGQQ